MDWSAVRVLGVQDLNDPITYLDLHTWAQLDFCPIDTIASNLTSNQFRIALPMGLGASIPRFPQRFWEHETQASFKEKENQLFG